LDRPALANFLDGLDIVFVMSGISGTVKGFEEYASYVETNEIGLLNVLDFCRKSGPACKIIYPSSRLVYQGRKNEALKENDPKTPKTIYALNKLTCEGALEMYANAYGIRHAVFRICVPYAQTTPGARSYGTMDHFINQASTTGRIKIYGDGSQMRTFTHIDDLTNAFIRAGLDSVSDGRTYNIGGADILSIGEVADRVAEHFSAEVQRVEWPDFDLKLETGDTIFDSSLLDAQFQISYEKTFDEWLVGQNRGW
jgi:UDP-glucose 4-epimerase